MSQPAPAPDQADITEPEVESEQQQAQEAEPFSEDKARAEVKAARDEAKNLRKRLREVEPLAAKAKEAEEAGKSEAQKWQDRYEALLAEKAELETEAIRERVARKAGLPDELAELLRGGTEAEMSEHAKRLSAYLTPSTERRRDPSQGEGPGQDDDLPLNGDPLLRDLKAKLHIP